MFDFVNLVHHANQKINCVMAKEDLITKLEEGHEVHCPKKCHQNKQHIIWGGCKMAVNCSIGGKGKPGHAVHKCLVTNVRHYVPD